jgi:hypothetical protein
MPSATTKTLNAKSSVARVFATRSMAVAAVQAPLLYEHAHQHHSARHRERHAEDQAAPPA